MKGKESLLSSSLSQEVFGRVAPFRATRLAEHFKSCVKTIFKLAKELSFA
jgi:hypothetical protein